MHVDLVKCWTKFEYGDYGEFNLLYILTNQGNKFGEVDETSYYSILGMVESILNSTTELKF